MEAHWGCLATIHIFSPRHEEEIGRLTHALADFTSMKDMVLLIKEADWSQNESERTFSIPPLPGIEFELLSP